MAPVVFPGSLFGPFCVERGPLHSALRVVAAITLGVQCYARLWQQHGANKELGENTETISQRLSRSKACRAAAAPEQRGSTVSSKYLVVSFPVAEEVAWVSKHGSLMVRHFLFPSVSICPFCLQSVVNLPRGPSICPQTVPRTA